MLAWLWPAASSAILSSATVPRTALTAAKSNSRTFLKRPPSLKTSAPGVEVYSLISSDDVLSRTPDFTYGGSPDGAGFLKNPDGTFTYVTNHEDNYSVSRITLDQTLKPVAGKYIMTSDEGLWRKCSATMATPEEHGFGPLFLTSSESGDDNINFAVNPSHRHEQPASRARRVEHREPRAPA